MPTVAEITAKHEKIRADIRAESESRIAANHRQFQVKMATLRAEKNRLWSNMEKSFAEYETIANKIISK